MLVDGNAPNNIEITQNYGYKKLITLQELMVLYPHVSALRVHDMERYCAATK